MEIDYVKTSDINLAATLHTLGHPIDGIHPKEGKIGIYDFYFRRSGKVLDSIDDYWSKRLLVEPQHLLNSRKDILTRMKDDATNH